MTTDARWTRLVRMWRRIGWYRNRPTWLAILLVLPLLACGRGPACPRAIGTGDVRPAPSCSPPAPKACAHTHRLPVPDAPPLTGYLEIDALRIEAHRRQLELWAALDWWACDGDAQ